MNNCVQNIIYICTYYSKQNQTSPIYFSIHNKTCCYNMFIRILYDRPRNLLDLVLNSKLFVSHTMPL